MMLECGCPSQYPDWHNEDINLGGWCAHILPVPMFLHMPVAYELYLGKQQQEISQLQLQERWPGFAMTRTGLFRGSILRVLEDTQSPSRHVKYLTGPFHVRAYLHHGNVSMIRDTVRKMQMELFDAGNMPRELYLCHLTCPRCEEKRGGEKILLLRRWEKSETLQRRIRSRQ